MPRPAPEKREKIPGCQSLPDKSRDSLPAPKGSPVLWWPGKTDRVCDQVFPFRVLEQVQHDQKPDWINKIIRGDNRLVLSSLKNGPMAEVLRRQGGLALVYLDPPFAVGQPFYMETGGSAAKKQARQLAYNDVWESMDSFLNMIHERLRLIHSLLAENGTLWLHCDGRLNACLRLMLDAIFPVHVNEIIWHYTGGGRSEKRFSRKHDTILVYAKSEKFIFNKDAIRVPYKPTSGYAKSGIRAASGKRYLPNPLGTLPDDVWDMPIINPMSAERTGYPTQKPEALLERIILAASHAGDLVADFFCGSGTLAAVAQRLGRKWLVVDESPAAIHATRKRLLALHEHLCQQGRASRPFALLELYQSACSQPVDNRVGEIASNEKKGRISICPHCIGTNLAIELTGYAPPKMMDSPENKVPTPDDDSGALKKNALAEPRIFPQDWRDLVDYWAVDFDYGHACMPAQPGEMPDPAPPVFDMAWHSCRDRHGRGLTWQSTAWRLSAGRHEVAVMVVDIFGHETMAVWEIGLAGDQKLFWRESV